MATVMEMPAREELAVQALSWKERAQAIQILDQETYAQACEMLKGVKELRDQAEAHHRPVIDAAHKAHKAALAALKSVDDPLVEAENILKRGVGQYTLEQQRIQAQREREAREALERQQAEQLEQQIEEAEQQGATQEEVLAMIETPLPAPKVEVAPAIQKSAGISVRETYSVEVVNLRLLCKEIAEGRQPVTLVTANMTALNGLARSLKTAFNVPGVKLLRGTSTAVR